MYLFTKSCDSMFICLGEIEMGSCQNMSAFPADKPSNKNYY
jgi:hypothetical protein